MIFVFFSSLAAGITIGYSVGDHYNGNLAAGISIGLWMIGHTLVKIHDKIK